MQKVIHFVFLTLTLTLTACTTVQSLSSAGVSTPTSTLASPTSTSLPTATFTPTRTPTPLPTSTLVPSDDYDNDGLSNLEEQYKYQTNPYEADSDHDGIPDNDWNERREYVYSVHVVMKLRQPFNLEDMNDNFQDVMVLEAEDSRGYTKLDILIYPETYIPLIEQPYPLTGLSDELISYTLPGITTNYTPEMQSEVSDIVGSVKTDLRAAKKIQKWFEKRTNMADLPYFPEPFYFTSFENEQVILRNYSSDISEYRILDELVFADKMFEKRSHGTCCSTATLKCGMYKAAGIPCKIIQTIFPVFYINGQTEPYENLLDRYWDNQFEDLSGNSWANHCFLELYLGGNWVRADYDFNIYHQAEGWLSVKILSVADLIEAPFYRTYPVNWISNRPYYVELVEDQEPIHFP